MLKASKTHFNVHFFNYILLHRLSSSILKAKQLHCIQRLHHGTSVTYYNINIWKPSHDLQ